ncbi:MAG: tRNA (N6-threonylcarbamoyladenosine(37)-N6)-methyltransferase TrmO [Deltaproteobacteria bacterium]|nr:tRNA (N6-threonylcarbamoyladenosine(37)-N6)-methyltransferase TrmO [Deltaproteobacteria bacterium]
MDTNFTFHPIGIIHSCFSEKFGIPRQPGLAPAARATLEMLPPYDRDEAFRGLSDFSHLWIVFVFHAIDGNQWQPTVRPPRLGGNTRIGVFASRSGFRPNPIGMSCVTLKGIRRERGKMLLDLSGIDLLDRTPVLDIKPYLPYADSIPDANGGYANEPPRPSVSIEFSIRGQNACTEAESTYPGFTELVIQVLCADPRPAYLENRSDRTAFGLRLYDRNIRWSVHEGAIVVDSIDKVSAGSDTHRAGQPS